MDGKLEKIDLSRKEDKFIQFLEMSDVMSWNGKHYVNYCVLGGYTWELVIAYDEKTMRAQGSNEYPKTLPNLLMNYIKYGECQRQK